MKNPYRSIAVDLIRQKKARSHPKVIQHTKFVGQSKTPDDSFVAYESMFALTILEMSKKGD